MEEEDLPMPTFDNLQIIVDELSGINDILKKRKIGQIIL
jgi:hypothetical protein